VQADIIQTLDRCYCNLQELDIFPEVIMENQQNQNSDTRITDSEQTTQRKIHFQVRYVFESIVGENEKANAKT
jgi:hypothetical protein